MPSESTHSESSDGGAERRDRVHYFPKDYYHANLPIEIPDPSNVFYQDPVDFDYIRVGSSAPEESDGIPFFRAALGEAEGTEPFWA